MVIRVQFGNKGSVPGREGIFSFLYPDQFLGRHSRLSKAYWVLFQRLMLLTTLYLLLKLRLGGFIHQLRICASRDS